MHSSSLSLPNLTYVLHKSLYIPLTSRSNTLTLPCTRGPKFFLPSHVVAALCRLRDLEQGTSQWKHWCMYLDTQDSPQVLPPPLKRVAYLKPPQDSAPPSSPEQQPSLQSRLLAEVKQELSSSSSFESIVFAGEGEPTLRFQLLLDVASQLLAQYELPMRLVTNGLVVNPNDNNINNNAENGGNDDQKDAVTQWCTEATRQLGSVGISSLSIAMMTANADQYNSIMQPLLLLPHNRDTSPNNNNNNNNDMTAHDRVCQFIKSAVQAGLNVETTGVDRPDVDKNKAEALALSLGVTNPFRWRPYFPS